MSVGPPANAEMPGADGRESILILAIIGGAMCGLSVTVFIAIAVVVIAVVICRCQNNPENTYDLPADYERPIPPPVESLPPRLEVNHAYGQVIDQSFEITDNSAYSA